MSLQSEFKTLSLMIIVAVQGKDPEAAGGVVETCQARGLNYNQIFEAVMAVCPDITRASWDALLYEADRRP